MIETAEHIAAIRREGMRLAEVAERAGTDAFVTTCPGWQVRDLVRHVGHVHRWATSIVSDGRAEPARGPTEDEMLSGGPPDGALIPWFRDGYASLVDALQGAPTDVALWTFLDAPTPLAFWARRQAHETSIHRADAESASAERTPFPPAFAADGIDELLMGFVRENRGGHRADPPLALSVRAADTGDAWQVLVNPDGVEVSRGAGGSSDSGGAGCAVTGPASDLYLLLWNRGPADGIAVDGDSGVLTWWRDNVRVRWS
jgi:uncharacterized protein (TIGR03083 family)